MKKPLILLIVILVSFFASGQTVTENYIKKISYQVETLNGITKRVDQSSLTDDNKIQTINYFDGLGRLKQSISKQAGGNFQDIIIPFVYDGIGRQSLDYLPFADANQTTPSLNYRNQTSLISDLEAYYDIKFPNEWGPSDVINPYSEKVLEESPLSRVLIQGAPGNDWSVDKSSIKFDFNTNTSNEVAYYKITFSNGNTDEPQLSYSGNFSANELYKIVTKDENWTSGTNNTTEEFKDKLGRVILKRTYSNNIDHDTYYVYDDFGNLTYVLPPKAEAHSGLPSGTILDELCYQYKYDSRNRLIEKKIPGKGWEYIVYNKLDKPILIQDQNLKAINKWLFTKYDQFGRVAYTGMMSSSDSRPAMQTSANGAALDQYVARNLSATTIAGDNIYYSNDANVYPTANITELHIIHYYDTYDNIGESFSNTVTTYKNVTSTSNAGGLPTISKVRVLDTNDWITNVSYYDNLARLIYTYSDNLYLNTTDEIEYDLDFTGKPLEIKMVHSKLNHEDITTYDQFSYDHMGRLLANKQEVNGQTPELIAQNYYDELGVLYKKDVGGSTSLDEPPGTIRPDPNLPSILEGYTDIVGVSHNATTGVITKTTGNGYNGGLATSGMIDSDGYVEYEMVQDNLYVTVGLAYSNPDTHYTSMDYAIDYNLYAGAYVYELGVSKAGQGGYVEYVPGDKFKIERLGDRVHYKKNDVTFYISTITSTGNLLGDLLLYSSQSKIKNLKIDRSYPTPQSMYDDVFGLDYDEATGIITKTIGNGWNGGLVTRDKISNDGYLEYEILQDDMYVVVGLAESNPDHHYTSMDYAIDHNGTAGAYVNELGVSKAGSGGYTTYVTGDVFKIERTGSTIYYKKNGNTFYTSSVSSVSENLLGDVALYSDQSKIKNLKLINNEMLMRMNNSSFDLNNTTPLQTINYDYNIRGWLSAINQDSFSDNDLFNFTISYNNPTGSGTALYNGNISQTSWNTLNTDSSTKTYTYGYDALNRITSGIDNTGNYNLASISYDKNGNILTLQREGQRLENKKTFGTMDDLVYTYDSGNKLLKVSDLAVYNGASVTTGFKDGDNSGDDFTYDDNGNLISDSNKLITNITYNHLNLPTLIQFDFVENPIALNTGSIVYVYDATGVKLKKMVVKAGMATDYAPEITYYAGNYVYDYTAGNGEQLKFFNHPEGYLEVNENTEEYEYVYQHKDHLGNIRLSYKDIDASNSIEAPTEIQQENNYYPFGLKHKGYNNVVNNVENKYKTFQSRELHEDLDLGWIEFKYRMHDPAIGRFIQVDPVADKYEYNGAYNFSENRVIDGIDLEGLEYVTVRHYMLGDKEMFKNNILYYTQTNDEINSVGGTTRGILRAASSGPEETSGIKHEYININTGKQVKDPVWEQRQNSIASSLEYHGLYSGGGSVTDGHGNYDFSFQPIAWNDAIAKRHDEDYFNATSSGEGYAGYVEDIRTYQADVDMVDRLIIYKGQRLNPFKKVNVPGVDTPVSTSWSWESGDASDGQMIVISALRDYKKWKIDNNYGNNDTFDTIGSQLKKDNWVVWSIINILTQNR